MNSFSSFTYSSMILFPVNYCLRQRQLYFQSDLLTTIVTIIRAYDEK